MQEVALDPRPIPPEKPLPSDCCESGCDRCVFEIHADELLRYQRDFAAWQSRQPSAFDGDCPPSEVR
ncbi:MAG: oxidoreductase-like domain-containing protein [Pseudomarimonas sp.]